MSYDDVLHQRVSQALNSEVPVRTEAHGIIARADGCVAWIDAVDLYSSVVLIRTCLIVTPKRAARAGTPYFSWTRDPATPDLQAEEVATTVAVDGGQFSSSDDTLHHTAAGSSSSGLSHASWWLPHAPTHELAVTVSVPSLGLRGTVTFDASSWPERIAHVLSV